MLFMKKLKLRLEPKIKVDDDKDNYKDEENEYLNTSFYVGVLFILLAVILQMIRLKKK